jgi:hypothetical protein
MFNESLLKVMSPSELRVTRCSLMLFDGYRVILIEGVPFTAASIAANNAWHSGVSIGSMRRSISPPQPNPKGISESSPIAVA